MLNDGLADVFLDVAVVVGSVNSDGGPCGEAVTDIAIGPAGYENLERTPRLRQQIVNCLDKLATRIGVALVQRIQDDGRLWVEVDRLEQLLLAGGKAEIATFQSRLVAEAAQHGSHLVGAGRGRGELPHAALEDGQRVATVLLVPLAIEKSKPLLISGT